MSNTTYTAYDLEGRVTNTWGATYPVAYVYDDQGRMTEMKTLRAENGTPDTTRWLYKTMSVLEFQDSQKASTGFTVVLHMRYSGVQSTGNTYLASKDILFAFSRINQVPGQSTQEMHLPLDSLPKFEWAKIWGECSVFHSNRISYLKSNTALIQYRGIERN